MSAINDALNENKKYAASFQLGQLPMPPGRKLAIVACMDARMTVEQFLGLKTGDAHIIRNAGGLVTEDALRSLIISYHLLGTREFMIINHTDCGMLTFQDADLKNSLYASTHSYSAVPSAFLPFSDVEANVRQQIAKVKSHPWLPQDVPVRGFVYDVKSGNLHEVK